MTVSGLRTRSLVESNSLSTLVESGLMRGRVSMLCCDYEARTERVRPGPGPTLALILLHVSRHTHGNRPHQPHDRDWAWLHPTGEGPTGPRRDCGNGRSPWSEAHIPHSAQHPPSTNPRIKIGARDQSAEMRAR